HIHPKQNIDIDHIQLSNLITNYRILQLVWSEPRRRGGVWCFLAGMWSELSSKLILLFLQSLIQQSF
ncbi:hypothetical protein LINPERHAP1_LOCUS32230, partial [Linum perenne]